MLLWNMTSHRQTIYDKHGERVLHDLASKGRLFLREGPRRACEDYKGIPIVDPPAYESVQGLPPVPPDGEIPALIVSRMVAPYIIDLWPGRVFVPDTSRESVVRRGREVIGVRRLEEWSPEEE